MAVKLDKKGNAVLAEFEVGGGRVDALLFRGPGEHPFVHACGYDRETGEWSQGRYFSDPARAYFAAHPEIVEESAAWWELEDFREKLRDYGIEPTRGNVAAVVDETRNMRYWKERAYEDGDEDIEEAVANVFGVDAAACRA